MPTEKVESMNKSYFLIFLNNIKKTISDIKTASLLKKEVKFYQRIECKEHFDLYLAKQRVEHYVALRVRDDQEFCPWHRLTESQKNDWIYKESDFARHLRDRSHRIKHTIMTSICACIGSLAAILVNYGAEHFHWVP